jgi:hypothetical protein
MSDPKESKTYHFHYEWEIDYVFVVVKDKCCCLICNASVSLLKRLIWNIILMLPLSLSMMLIFHPRNEIFNFKLKKLKLAARQQLMANQGHFLKMQALSSLKVSNLIVKNSNHTLKGNL